MSVLSIQSSVVYGHVGNSAAAFALQRIGVDVWPVSTVAFSNNPDYGGFRGEIIPAAQVAALVEGLAERGFLPECRAVLSGYLGDAATGEAVVAAAARVRAARLDAVWCCDPVMGDAESGLYVRGGIPAFFRERAVPEADILTPNRFELELLAGRSAGTVDDALAAARSLRSRMRPSGPRLVVATSVETGADALAVLAVGAGVEGEEAAWAVTTPRLKLLAKGTGDLFSALFLGRWLRSRDARESLEHAASACYAVVAATSAAEARELRLIAAQDFLVTPERWFAAERIA